MVLLYHKNTCGGYKYLEEVGKGGVWGMGSKPANLRTCQHPLGTHLGLTGAEGGLEGAM